MPRQSSPEIVVKARRLRREMTLPEVLLWRLLRKEPLGIKFRRQHPAGSYVLDFYCPQAKIGIEIDGKVHDAGGNPLRDEDRDLRLLELGIRIVRIPAADVLKSVDRCAEQIVLLCRERIVAPPPR